MNVPGLEGQRLHWLIGTIVVSAFGYLAFSLWGGWGEVVAAFRAVGLGGVLIVLALSLVNYGLRLVRWERYLVVLGHRLPVVVNALIYVGGFALTTTPGKAGELLRGVFLKKRGIPYSQSTAAFFSERLSDLVAIVLLSLLGLGLYPQGEVVLLFGAVLVIVGLLVLSRAHLLVDLRRELTLGDGRVKRGIGHVLSLLVEARRCHGLGILLVATVLSLLAWSAEAYGFYLILQWMGQEVSLMFAFSVYALAMLAGALSFLPGGLGGTETVMVGLLLWAEMPHAQAIAATIIVRLATLWFAVAIGGIALCLVTKSKREYTERACNSR